MSKRLLIVLTFFCLLNSASAREMKPGEFLALSYHAVPEKAPVGDKYSVPQNLFVEQMEYLRVHGFNPVSLDDILKASQGKKELPPKPVLLTFDDAYRSYYEFVVPVLEKYGYPSVLAVVGSWIDHPPEDIPEPLMNWEQIRKVAKSSLVEVVSHTYDLHKAIQYNPQGNVGAAVSVRVFDPKSKSYETAEEYRSRIKADFIAQKDLFTKQLGITPKAIVWPYGRYNAISMEVAREAGYRFGLTFEEELANVNRLHEINRNAVLNEPMREFIRKMNRFFEDKPLTRAVQIDLDLVYDPNSYEQTDKNLGKLIERLVNMKVNTVFLQAFSDPEGTGNVKSVYFYNRVLPVRADIFSHAVHQMIIRDIMVYAWMPVLSIELPDKKLNQSLRVQEYVGDNTRPSTSWYNRLTPFSPKVRELVRTIYEDLAAHSQIHGILFQDDAYLTNREDYHPLAVKSYKAVFGKEITPDDLDNDPGLALNWARYKTEVLIDFTETLMKEVRRFRPAAKSARNLYAKVLTDPESEIWFAQNYEHFLKSYDQVVVMAYPEMEQVSKPSEWLKGLTSKVKDSPAGTKKTVFKIQAYDWSQENWINDNMLLNEIRDILASGGLHIAYYPDNFWINKPCLAKIKLEMSTKAYPFMP